MRCERALPCPTVRLRARPPARRGTRLQLVFPRPRRHPLASPGPPRPRRHRIKPPPPGALAASPVSLPVRACSAPLSSSYPTSTPLPPRTSAASRVDAGRVTSAESAPQRHRRTNSRRKHRRRRSLAARQGASRSLSTFLDRFICRCVRLRVTSAGGCSRAQFVASRARFCPGRERAFASDRSAGFSSFF